MINQGLLNSTAGDQMFGARRRRKHDSFLSCLPKVSSTQYWAGYSGTFAKRQGLPIHANSGPPILLKSLDLDIMLAERVADLARRHLEQARGLGLHPASRLHRFEQTFPISLPISMQYVTSV
jgi:hypothetical protein